VQGEPVDLPKRVRLLSGEIAREAPLAVHLVQTRRKRVLLARLPDGFILLDLWIALWIADFDRLLRNPVWTQTSMFVGSHLAYFVLSSLYKHVLV